MEEQNPTINPTTGSVDLGRSLLVLFSILFSVPHHAACNVQLAHCLPSLIMFCIVQHQALLCVTHHECALLVARYSFNCGGRAQLGT